jgi:hypothetical protein
VEQQTQQGGQEDQKDQPEQEAGAQEGDTVYIGEYELEYQE